MKLWNFRDYSFFFKLSNKPFRPLTASILPVSSRNSFCKANISSKHCWDSSCCNTDWAKKPKNFSFFGMIRLAPINWTINMLRQVFASFSILYGSDMTTKLNSKLFMVLDDLQEVFKRKFLVVNLKQNLRNFGVFLERCLV